MHSLARTTLQRNPLTESQWAGTKMGHIGRWNPWMWFPVWLAGTRSKKDNACMRVIPGTQNKRLLDPSEMMGVDTEEYVLDLAIHPDEIDESKAVGIELNAGDLSIHNPFIIHGSNANVSNQWRVELTLRYIPTSTYVNREGWECILLRGNSKEKINNNYANRPKFIEGKHMPFLDDKLYR